MENKDFTIDTNKKFYPSADEWMWNYCTFLGQFTDSDGDNYDLGILLKDSNSLAMIGDYSLAVVYGDTPGDYISGCYFEESEKREFVIETLRRAKMLNLIK